MTIAVLVNDDPITEYEIRQRAQLLAAGPGLRKQVEARFKNLIKRPSTNKRLRSILKETIEANQGRSREQILAIFERRKTAYAKSSLTSSIMPGWITPVLLPLERLSRG